MTQQETNWNEQVSAFETALNQTIYVYEGHQASVEEKGGISLHRALEGFRRLREEVEEAKEKGLTGKELLQYLLSTAESRLSTHGGPPFDFNDEESRHRGFNNAAIAEFIRTNSGLDAG